MIRVAIRPERHDVGEPRGRKCDRVLGLEHEGRRHAGDLRADACPGRRAGVPSPAGVLNTTGARAGWAGISPMPSMSRNASASRPGA